MNRVGAGRRVAPGFGLCRCGVEVEVSWVFGARRPVSQGPAAARRPVSRRKRAVSGLRARCEDETLLAPPKPPEFNRRVLRFLQEREAKAAEAGAAAE